jgi:Helix-turn-helix domain
MPSSKFLPSIRDSETVTCPRCKVRQYPRNGASGTCVRCHTLLGLEYVRLEIDALLDPCSEDAKKHFARSIGDLLRTLRKRRGICQSQLAVRAAGCIARSNLSRAECGRTLLPLNKLLKIAKALGLTAVILRFEVATPRRAHPSRDRG